MTHDCLLSRPSTVIRVSTLAAINCFVDVSSESWPIGRLFIVLITPPWPELCTTRASNFKDYFVSWEVARALCGLISPDGYTTTKQFSVVNTFKGIANNISFDVYNALDYDE